MMTESELQFIETTTYGLQWYGSQGGKQGFDKEIFEDMICHIMAVLSKWTGETWVGHKKDKRTENVFQDFFKTLVGLIGYIDFFEKMMSDEEKEFAMMVTYRGIIYLYLGSGSSCNKERVVIEYNDIYVSWSKKEQNDGYDEKDFEIAYEIPKNNMIDLNVHILKEWTRINWRLINAKIRSCAR